MPDDITHRHFKVPREDHSLLALPPLAAASQIVERNRRLFAESQVTLHGRSLKEIRAAAQSQVLSLATAYTAELMQVELPEVSASSLIVSGHQPELFHVGVWAKNFALTGIARRVGATAINLVIDNDTLNDTSIRVPTGGRERLRADRIPFDAPHLTQPWEDALIRDHAVFEQFGQTVRHQIQSAWSYEPLIGAAWKAAIRESSVSQRLCDGLTAFRVHLERAWGLTNLEVPMSRLCESDSFLWFAAHLLLRASEVHQVYNDAVAEYRRSHELRNRMQPVPDLERDGDWFESPFWVWKRGETQRGRLFVRRSGSLLELRKEQDVILKCPVDEKGSLAEVVVALGELPGREIRLRTRALTTTLFARVCLADLFVHGIGGAKYDEMTNQLCQRLFQLDAPEFSTVSATLYLPLGGTFATTAEDLRKINQSLRDLAYNPDRHLPDAGNSARLVSEKMKILAEAKVLRDSQQLKGRLTHVQHLRLAELRGQLGRSIKSVQSEYEQTRNTILAQLAVNSLVRNREFAFALYPEELVKQFLIPLSLPD